MHAYLPEPQALVKNLLVFLILRIIEYYWLPGYLPALCDDDNQQQQQQLEKTMIVLNQLKERR